jgi:acyl-coenzyme A thioesterase PaaI-like protein
MSVAIHPCLEPRLEPRAAAPLNPECIACGRENPHGLHLRFESKGQIAVSEWMPSEVWQGFRGVIHGGVITTVLDEAMSKAVVARGWEALTAELTVRLRKKVVPGERLMVLGMVVSRRKREIRAEASLVDREGGERAHAWAKFLVLR